MSKTAMQELIEKYKLLPKSSNECTNGCIKDFIEDATELLEKEKQQMKDLIEWCGGEKGFNLIDDGETTESLLNKFFTQTYKQ